MKYGNTRKYQQIDIFIYQCDKSLDDREDDSLTACRMSDMNDRRLGESGESKVLACRDLQTATKDVPLVSLCRNIQYQPYKRVYHIHPKCSETTFP